MRAKHHLLATSIFFLLLYFAFDAVRLSAIFAPIFITLFPDVDLHLGSHRNWFFHSVFLWVAILLFNFDIYHALFVVSVGFHLLCDITLFPSKWVGYYCVKWWKRGMFPRGRQGVMSTMWYVFNFVCALAIFKLFV